METSSNTINPSEYNKNHGITISFAQSKPEFQEITQKNIEINILEKKGEKIHINLQEQEKESLTEAKNSNLNEKNGKKEENRDVPSFFRLFRYAKKLDYFFLIVGAIASIANGALMPIFSIL